MLVSVVIPSYNHKKYVIQAIESVLDQSWPHIDLIVIDDGSRDGSSHIIQELLDQRGGFRFVTRQNLGLLKTLNEGLQLARGEFFCELASDDYFPANSIELRVKYLQRHPECVAVFGDGSFVKNNIVLEGGFLKEKHRKIFLEHDPIPDMLTGQSPVFSSALIRRDTLLGMGGFDENTFRYYEDLDTPILLALQGRLGLVDSTVICHREHETNVSSSTSHVRVEKVLCYRKLLAEPKLRYCRSILKFKLRRSLLALGRSLDNRGGGSPEERQVFRSIGWPFSWQDPRLLWYLLKWGR
jgi:alpha-1,3-rhamnosyltransferase